MGNCIYCSQPAGFLRSKHNECESTYNNGKQAIVSILDNVLSSNLDREQVTQEINSIAAKSYITEDDLTIIVANTWSSLVDTAFEDGILTKSEEDILNGILNEFSLIDNISSLGNSYTGNARRKLQTSYDRLNKGCTLRTVLEEQLPEEPDALHPFNLMKSESLIWVFDNVDYFEEKNKTSYVGGSHGVSVRVAKGVYFRTGSFKGKKVVKSENMHIDTGVLGVTTKHLYFSGKNKRFRIRFDKIVSFEPFSDSEKRVISK